VFCLSDQHEFGERSSRWDAAVPGESDRGRLAKAGCSGFQSTRRAFRLQGFHVLLYAVRKNGTSPEPRAARCECGRGESPAYRG